MEQAEGILDQIRQYLNLATRSRETVHLTLKYDTSWCYQNTAIPPVKLKCLPGLFVSSGDLWFYEHNSKNVI